MKNDSQYTGLEIAIVGMSCRFPGAMNWRTYWDNLIAGTESVEFLSDDILKQLGVDASMANHPDYVKVRTVFEKKDAFDSAFFDYRPSEARLMNPVHRIFHECIWEALEDAGCNPERAKGPIGIFAGAREDLNWKVYSVLKNKNEEIDDFTLHHINNRDFLATLLSYKLNLQGPAFTINTGCSTSLVALNLACKSLLMGETRIALAGGASIETRIQKGYLYQEGMINSKDGHCRAFDKNASGTTVGEGAGVVVLKKLADAIHDKDHIYAIVKGSAINNDGNRKVGFTAPSVEGQVECIRKALRFAKVEPDSIGYIETHGTGTRLGDLVESEALKTVFGARKEATLAIGSVKSNIGHLDAAAGIAGLIKTVLSLKYKQIPPSLHFNEPNPDIDFEGGKFYVNNSLVPWVQRGIAPLRAGVSSFGIGGTNAHVILEEAPVEKITDQSTLSCQLLALSAKTEGALMRYAKELKRFLAKNDISLPDAAYTWLTGRKHFEYRYAVPFHERSDLLELLDDDKIRQTITRSKNGNAIVFMFSGAGSQYPNMGKMLYLNNPTFRTEMDKGFGMLDAITGQRYSNILYPTLADDQRVNKMLHTQPVIFLFGYSLARMMMSWGVVPQYMIGHSIGEYVAACISGVFNFEDALKLVVRRGQLMDQMPPGGMLSVSISEEDSRVFINDTVSIASINSPGQVVFSGDLAAIDALTKRLEASEFSFVRLYASQAGHSWMIEQIMGDYATELGKVKMNAPKIPFVSNLTGKMIEADEAQTPAYWLRHMRETVKFSNGIKTLQGMNDSLLFIEMGGGHSLTTLVRQHQVGTIKPLAINLIRHPKETNDDENYLLSRLGQLWAAGVNVDWLNYYKGEAKQRIPLPTYAFEPIKYPTEVNPFEGESFEALPAQSRQTNHDLKDWIYFPVWKSAPILPLPSVERLTFLYFTIDASLSESIQLALTQQGHHVIVVGIGEHFQKEGEYRYLVNPERETDFQQMLNDLPAQGKHITNVIYEWAIKGRSNHLLIRSDDNNLTLTYFGVATIIKALLSANALSKKHITLLTAGLHAIHQYEGYGYNQALTLAFASILPQEYSVTCTNIDYDSEEESFALALDIAGEILNKSHTERTVAIRNGQRWTCSYQKNTIPVKNDGPTVIRQRGIYLITGGLGHVGFILAKHLLEKYEANVALLGRRPLASDDLLDKFNQLRAISERVYYYQADIADLAGFESVVEKIESVQGAVRGVFHTAGVMDKQYYELVEDLTQEKAKAVFAPKIAGIQHLRSVFEKRNPDFVWITSSLASVLGGLSYCAYAAANLYMEHFVSARLKHLASWRCVGLSEMFFLDEDALQSSTDVRKGLLPTEIVRLMEWSLTLRRLPVLFETTTDLETRRSQIFDVKKDAYLDSKIDIVTEGKERPELNTAYAAPETELEKRLVDMFENFFGIKGIGIEDNFFELGGDSLKGMMLLKKIKNEFDVYIPLSAFFQGQTVKQISLVVDELKRCSSQGKKTSKIRI